MGFVYDFDSAALLLRKAKPIKYNGAWNVIKDALLKSGEIKEEAGVIQKVISVNKAASATETAGETLSALCAVDVSESTVAGVTTTTLTPTAAITFTPKTVALSAIAGALGLDFGVRIGQNLVNLYFGEEWDWHAPGIFDAAKDAIRTYVKADGTTYYDEETINAFSNRLNEIGAFSESFEPEQLVKGEKITFLKNLYYNPADSNLVGVVNVNTAIALCCNKIIETYNLSNEFFKRTLTYIRTTKEDKRKYIEVASFFIKDGESIKYLYDYDMYVHSTANNDDDLIVFNDILSSNLGNALNPTKKIYLTIDRSSVIDKYISIAFSEFYTDNNGENWHEVLTTLGGVNPYSNIDLYYSQFAEEHFYFPLGTLEGVKGVDKQQDATVPSTFPLDIPQTYPNWQSYPIVRPEDSAITYPVVMPNTDVLDGVATKPQDVAQTGVNEDAENSKVIEDAITIVPEIAQDIEATADPTIDGGDTPTPIIPSIGAQATGFVALYNPTQSQLSAFSQYLWSNDFIENFKKLFSNPMDAIIGLHLIYATPSRGDVAEIVCGYSHSGVMSNTVNSQYIEIDCGSIKVNRYFGNVLDYAPYTKLQVYLPFVGIVDLDTNEIMNGTLNIKYRIDVLTGSCLARLKITRGDYKAELYNFAGNCAVQLPISGGSYSGIIANAIGVAGSIGATIASGGSLAPVLVGSAVSSAVNSHTNVSHSGSLGSNAGALGIMKPYLIITRPKPAEANKFNEFYGKPSNKTVRLSSCNGYTRIKEVHVDNIVATDNELSEIEQLLKEGVII